MQEDEQYPLTGKKFTVTVECTIEEYADYGGYNFSIETPWGECFDSDYTLESALEEAGQKELLTALQVQSSIRTVNSLKKALAEEEAVLEKLKKESSQHE